MPPPLRHPYIAIVAYYRFREIKKTEMRPCHNASRPRRGLGAQGGASFHMDSHFSKANIIN